MQKRPEIMSPAGDFTCLDAALKAGADAVYFGVEGANMRAAAKNFRLSDLKKISDKCREFGAKAYLALNTIYFDSELQKLRKIVKAAAAASIDAVIAWDLSAVCAAKEAGLNVFLSTQASVANSVSIAAWHRNFGIDRFVLARECTLEHMRAMRKSLKKMLGTEEAAKISFEVFAHGAMCVSVSGRCFLSEFLCGKSANRGECRQFCRRAYTVEDDSGNRLKVGTDFILSPKDICTAPFIERLFRAGVGALKIEGRNRNPEYVYAVTCAYKNLRDFWFENRKKANFDVAFDSMKLEAMKSLGDVFNRGFSDGFFMGMPLSDWRSNGNMARVKKTIVGHVENYFPKIGVAEISVDNLPVTIGMILQAEGPTTGFARFKVESMRDDSGEISRSEKGSLIAVKTPVKLRRNDRIYAMV